MIREDERKQAFAGKAANIFASICLLAFLTVIADVLPLSLQCEIKAQTEGNVK